MTSPFFKKIFIVSKEKKAALLTNPVIYIIKIAPLFFLFTATNFLHDDSFFFSWSTPFKYINTSKDTIQEGMVTFWLNTTHDHTKAITLDEASP